MIEVGWGIASCGCSPKPAMTDFWDLEAYFLRVFNWSWTDWDGLGNILLTWMDFSVPLVGPLGRHDDTLVFMVAPRICFDGLRCLSWHVLSTCVYIDVCVDLPVMIGISFVFARGQELFGSCWSCFLDVFSSTLTVCLVRWILSLFLSWDFFGVLDPFMLGPLWFHLDQLGSSMSC